MSFILPYPAFTCPTGDGRNFVLQDYLYFIDKNGNQYRGIKGGITDGASTPREIWITYPPFGLYWIAAVFHDLMYRAEVEMLVNVTWIRVQLPKDICDSLLLEAMTSLGVDEITKSIIYNAVKDFGNNSFSDDLAKPITE